MSEHSEVVRDYVALRNHLAKSNPKPNVKFEVQFKVEGTALMAFNSLTGAKIKLAGVRPFFFRLFFPYEGSQFESYSMDLINFINSRLIENGQSNSEIINLA